MISELSMKEKNNKVAGFSSVNENELMNVDGGAIWIIVACVGAVAAGVVTGYLINRK